MLLNVYVLDKNLNDVTGLEQLGGMLDEAVGHLGDVKKTVVVNTDVNEATEVDNVADGALELHAGLKVGDVENVGGEDGSGRIVTDISAGLLKLGDNVVEGGLTAAKLTGELCDAVLLCLEAKESEVSCGNVLGGEIESLKKVKRYVVGLGVNSGVVKDLLTAGDTKEACALGECLLTDLRNLKYLGAVLELTVLLSILNDVLCSGCIDARNVGKKRVGCGVDVNAYTVNTILDNATESLGESCLLHIVLILTYADRARLDLYKLGKWVLKSTCDRNSRTLHNVKIGELLSRKLGC